MLRFFRFVFPLFFVALAAATVFAQDVLKTAKHATSLPFSQLVGGNSIQSGSNGQTPNARATRLPFNNPHSDVVAAPFAGPLNTITPGLNFDGQSADDNRNVFKFAFVPPDTNGAVGATQYVQMVNVTIAVYDKSSGSIVQKPAPIHTLWKGFGGLCENGGGPAFPKYSDGGDPVVLYDHLANRWLVTQLQYDPTFTQTAQCVAVSTTSDATGSYNLYEYDFGADFPDYPKWGIWPDAYYNTINVFPPKSFAGARACAFDRNAMLAGADEANAICFRQPSSVSSLLPSDLDGSTLPPAGSPNYFVGLADSSHLNFFRFHVDFAKPEKSTFVGDGPNVPTLISVSPYNEICARAVSVSCIDQPSPGENVDGLSDRVMFRFAYRNFGDHESLVVNHTIKGGALAGVRWYEIRNPSAPFVFQQSTLVDPNVNYWLGSIAMDRAGNTALGFSASGHSQYPSVWVGGRSATDPAGAMFGPFIIVNGTGVQVQSYKRWGDYSAMTLDPTDDCTFWYTNEYYATTGSFDWATRIGSFKFNSCKAHGR